MSPNSSTENPFLAWEDLRNDFLSQSWSMTVFQILALTAATLHFIPWIRQVCPLVKQMWKEPLQRFLASPQRWRDMRQNSVVDVSALVTEISFLLVFPGIMLFPFAVYIGLPVFVLYGAPLPFFVHDDSRFSLTFSVIVLWILLLHALDMVMTYWIPRFDNEKPSKVWLRFGRLGLLTAFFGALSLWAVAKEMNQIDSAIQYVGPVRLSNIALYYHDGSDTNPGHPSMSDGEGSYPYVYASWTAEWGAHWACPHLPGDHWCQVRQTACHHTTCYHSECPKSAVDLSYSMTRECLNMISLHWSDGAYDSTQTFDRNVSPRQDGKHWPTMYAYANCDTCEIYGGTRTGYSAAADLLGNLPQVERFQSFGLALLVLGWTSSALALVWTLVLPSSRIEFDAVPLSSGDTGDLELEVVLPAAASA